MDPEAMNETTDATAIFAPLWRRKWLILAVGLVVGAASYIYYKHQTPVYQASTQVYLGASSEEQAPGEKGALKSKGVNVTNQVQLINSIVLEEVHRRLKAEHKGQLSHTAKVRARSPEKSEFINISTEAHSARGAALVANLVAQTYVRRQNANHRRAIESAIAITRRQLRRLEAASVIAATKTSASKSKNSASSSSSTSTSTTATTSPATSTGTAGTASVIQAANLSSKINQLEASLATVPAIQLKPARASNALLLSPKPRQDAVFGFVIGLVLAAIAAYVLDRLDRRLRSLGRIEEVMHASILAALPKVSRTVIHGEGGPRPSGPLLEPVRRLYTALQAIRVPSDDAGHGPTAGVELSQSSQGAGKAILFISADPGDGKSTLVANLALVQRDAGARVVVVEANFRRPVQARLLGLEGAHGLGEVLTGALAVEDAMQRVMPHDPASLANPGMSGGGLATAVQAQAGSLFLLAGGGLVANPPALLAQESMSELLRSLVAEFDYVLIDAPSPLELSDAVPLLGAVTGTVVVARAGHTREASARRLRQLLDSPAYAPVLGVAANCVARSDLKRYGFSSPDGRAWPGGLTGR
jgi:Mrp family chromosome partitioning ATPase/capsular polysaccharide biosynthesis protein